MNKNYHSKIALFFALVAIVFITTRVLASAYLTEDYTYLIQDYLDDLVPVDTNHDGLIALELLNPADVKQTITFSFPTRKGSILYRHQATRHYGENPRGYPLGEDEGLDPQDQQKAEFFSKMNMELIFKTWDIDDVLSFNAMQDFIPNFNELNSKPPDNLSVVLRLKSYNQSLRRKEAVTLEQVIKRNVGAALLMQAFPEKTNQKFDKIKEAAKKKFGVDRFSITPPTTVSTTKNCSYDYSVGKPKHPYNYKLAQITLLAECVIGGVLFGIHRNTYHDASNPREDLAATITHSMNYIEEIVNNTIVGH